MPQRLSKEDREAQYRPCIRCGKPGPKPRNITLDDRLKEHVVINSITGCHEWTGAWMGNGYGYFTVLRPKKKNIYVHRAVYERNHGDLNGLHVLHKCDNPCCCNPDHLFAGTRSDNSKDMVRKGRQPAQMKRGGGNTRRKLTQEQADYIKLSSESDRVLGKRFGVHNACIWSIRAGKTY